MTHSGMLASRADIRDSTSGAEGGCTQRLKTVSWLLGVLLSSTMSPGQSQSATIRGAGASSCSDYAQVYDAFRPSVDPPGDSDSSRRAAAAFFQYEEWIDGYILGLETGSLGSGVRRDWDRVDVGRWIYIYCQEHRSDIIANAALALFKEMGGPPY